MFVREMLTATALSGANSGAVGYLIRQADSGTENVTHEDICDEIAVQAMQDFLGVNLQCVSCHDGAGHLEKTNLWLSKRKRLEFWRQVIVFRNHSKSFSLRHQRTRKVALTSLFSMVPRSGQESREVLQNFEFGTTAKRFRGHWVPDGLSQCIGGFLERKMLKFFRSFS